MHTPPNPFLGSGDSSSGELSSFDRIELQALYRFVEVSLQESSPPSLIALALQIIQDTIGATVAGFLDLDEKNPLPKLVLPDRGRVDTPLSQQLTKMVQQEKRTVWLARSSTAVTQSESLLGYTDAVCVPVKIETEAFGAIHVYQQKGMLTEKQVHFCKVLAGSLAKSLAVARYHRALQATNERLSRENGGMQEDVLVGSGKVMSELRQMIDRFAQADGSNVLITGETGVGKELVAAALHHASHRRAGPLVIVNCAAIPDGMADRELFGSREGAYTTATRDISGFFEQADMGTLVLDEIGELAPTLQTKLLRAMESGTFRPIGAEEDVTSDVRVLALTNRNLVEECEAKNFRWDLFYRLNITIEVLPLRERLEDIPELSEHLLRILAKKHRRRGKSLQLSTKALKRLTEYDWPGNVRQLRSVLDRAVAMTDGHVIEPEHLGPLHHVQLPPTSNAEETLTLKQAKENVIRRVWDKHNQVLSHAAKELDICTDTLRKHLREMGILDPGEKK